MSDLVPLPNNNVNKPVQVWKKNPSVVCFSTAILGHPFGCFPSNSVHYLIQNDCALFFFLYSYCIMIATPPHPFFWAIFFIYSKIRLTISPTTLSTGGRFLTLYVRSEDFSEMCFIEITPSWNFSRRYALWFFYLQSSSATCQPASADTVCIYPLTLRHISIVPC